MNHNNSQFGGRINEFRTILERSLSRQDSIGSEARAAVYQKARMTLAEHFAKDVQAGNQTQFAFQRDALEAAIAQTEAEALAAAQSGAGSPNASGGASSASTPPAGVKTTRPPATQPPAKPPFPGQVHPPADRPAEQPTVNALSSAASRPAPPVRPNDAGRLTAPGAISSAGSAGTAQRSQPTPTVRTDAAAAPSGPARARNPDSVWRENRRKGVLIALSILMCGLYLLFRPQIDTAIRLGMSVLVAPEEQSESRPVAAVPDPPLFEADHVSRVRAEAVPILRPVNAPASAFVSGRLDVNEAGETGFTRITFEDQGLVIRIEWQADTAPESNIVHVIDMVFERSEERVFTASMIEMWSDTAARFETLNGTPVRVGLNRIVYGVSETIAPRVIDHAVLGDSVITRITIRFESGESVELIFPMRVLAVAG